MGPHKRIEARSWRGSEPQKSYNKLSENYFSMLATGACTCGGPGGRPGMVPICRNCLAADRYMRAVEFSRLIGWNRTGYAPC